ncbi:MAG: hydrogenase expression/formation protein HypE [Chloroflexota bacterium]
MNNNDTKFNSWSCPLPLRSYPSVVLSHGGGGKLSSDLIQHLFLPEFDNPILASMSDAAVVQINVQADTRVAISTDSYTVTPLFFPGGDIGKLAIHGTVNDVAMSGATPMYITAAFILEEGLPMETLHRVAESMAEAGETSGVSIIAGDTKVVGLGHGDGVYVNTTGFGIVPEGVKISVDQAKPGDVVLVSGDIGDHGIAILSIREGLEFESPVLSDTAPLHTLVNAMLAVSKQIHCLRDPTRGGLAATLNEIAAASGVGIHIDENSLPIAGPVQAACEMLGLDPLHIANEGKLVAVVPQEIAESILERLKQHPLGTGAAIIGQVVSDHPGMVVASTGIGGRRIVDQLVGDQLPRIC